MSDSALIIIFHWVWLFLFFPSLICIQSFPICFVSYLTSYVLGAIKLVAAFLGAALERQ